MATQTTKRTMSFLAGGMLLLILSGAYYGLVISADMADISNPHANLWRAVRQGIAGFMTAPSEGHTVLIRNGGENWRGIRNGILMRYAQWLPALALVAMGLFYLFVGGEKLEKQRSGIMIERYALAERVLHWYTATMFILMALTGLSILLGRVALIPLLGRGAVSGYLRVAKVLHNYCGPLLLAGIYLEFILWVRLAIPKKVDLLWFKNMGGMIGKKGGPRPPVGKINGGQKAWFWLVFLFGSVVGLTGIVMNFPGWGQTRFIMQVSHVIHVTAAVLFFSASFGHIYMGTVGAEGAFEGMWKGSVDAVWAQQNHDLWYEEKKREQADKPVSP
jgi:formate dehydrogenase subunit gamma